MKKRADGLEGELQKARNDLQHQQALLALLSLKGRGLDDSFEGPSLLATLYWVTYLDASTHALDFVFGYFWGRYVTLMPIPLVNRSPFCLDELITSESIRILRAYKALIAWRCSLVFHSGKSACKA